MSAQSIPNYGLYGEPRESMDSLGIHIEEIEERSKGRDWVIKPHRHGNLFQVICILDGEACIQLDDEIHEIVGHGLVTIPAGTVHGFSFNPGTQGYVISFSDQTLDNIRQLQGSDYLRPLIENAVVVGMADRGELASQLENYIALMRYELGTTNRARFTSLVMLATLFLVNIKRQLDSETLENSPGASQLRTLDAFRRLLEQHFREHWKVSEYADALNISTSTLNRLCHERFGTNAKAIIASRVISEAKRRLVFTRQPLDQVAYYLGYRDPAYFSRVFKKIEKLSPGEYRRKTASQERIL